MARSVETVYLLLKADGADVTGDTTDSELGLENAIECVHFDHRGEYRRESAAGAGSARRIYEPILIRKRIDRASALIWRAFTESQNVEAEFKFVRPDPARNNQMEHFYTIRLENARVTAVRQYVPDKLTASGNSVPPLEEVGFVFERITWRWGQGGAEHRDQWTSGG